ncbi:MAG: hypothetical protein ABIQ95_04940 [Bdellovibrionia bacterium]
MSETIIKEDDDLFNHFVGIFSFIGFISVAALWQNFISFADLEGIAPEVATSLSTTLSTPSSTMQKGSHSDHKTIQDMAEYLTQNPGTTSALSTGVKSNSGSQLFDISLNSSTEFLPENSEKLAHRMIQIAAENPTELASEFKKTFSGLLWNHAEERGRLLQLASYVADTPSGDQVKQVVLEQAELFIPSGNSTDSTFGKDAFQAYLDMEKDPVKRKQGASRITSTFVESDSP